MIKTFDVIVGGGGLIGCIVALALSQSGFSVALIEGPHTTKKSRKKFDGRAYALALASKRMLSALDLWDAVKSNAEAILNIKVSDGAIGNGASPLHMHFDHQELEDGPMGYMIEDRFLRIELAKNLKSNALIDKFRSKSIVDQKTYKGFIEVKLDSGQVLKAKMLIGSDGKNSAIGKRAGLRRLIHNYKQISLVAAVSHQYPHFGEAHQFFVPAGPIAILPLPKNRSSVVWTEDEVTAKKVMELNDNRFLDELKDRFGDFRGHISLNGDRFSYPLSLSISEKLTSDRVVLVGDAAHSLHPIAGQGLNLGFRDIASLVEVITVAARRGEDIGSLDVLKRYSSWRNLDRISITAVTHGVNKLFSNDNSVLRLSRDLGMAAINLLPSLKRSLIREASGVSGDIPLLLKGLRL